MSLHHHFQVIDYFLFECLYEFSACLDWLAPPFPAQPIFLTVLGNPDELAPPFPDMSVCSFACLLFLHHHAQVFHGLFSACEYELAPSFAGDAGYLLPDQRACTIILRCIAIKLTSSNTV